MTKTQGVLSRLIRDEQAAGDEAPAGVRRAPRRFSDPVSEETAAVPASKRGEAMRSRIAKATAAKRVSLAAIPFARSVNDQKEAVMESSPTHPEPASAPARRLLRIAGAYMGVAIAGIALSFIYEVGAEPGSDPASDLALRGTALAAPLFLPAILIPAAARARARGRAGAVGTVAAGLVGIAFLLGGTLNLANDLDAARAAGAPTALGVAFGLANAIFGLVLFVHAALALAARVRHRGGEPSVAARADASRPREATG